MFLGLHADAALYVTAARAYHMRETTFGLHEIFKCAYLKFTVYGRKQTYIHTTSANAVTLVWGSLRLAPKRHLVSVISQKKHFLFSIGIVTSFFKKAILKVFR